MQRDRPALLLIPTAIALGVAALFLFSYRADLPASVLSSRYADQRSEFVSVHGVNVHVRDDGEGDTLILLHDAGASLHVWDGWIEPLRHDLRVVRLDLPGFGLTGPDPQDDYRIARYVEFVRAFAAELQLEEFHLGGHGLGGQVAWNYALEHPDDVRRLVLVAPSGYPRGDPPPSSGMGGIARVPGVRWLAAHMTPRAQTEAMLRQSVADPAAVTDALVDRYYELSLRPGNRRARIERAIASAADVNGDHARIRQPTLILWGMADRLAPLADARGFVDDIGNARLLTFPGVGHLVPEELPQQSARAALTFLRDRAGDDTPR